MRDRAVTSVRHRHAFDRNDGESGALLQNGVQLGHRAPSAEGFDRHGGQARVELEVDEDTDVSARFEMFERDEHGALLRDNAVAAYRSQLVEDRAEQGIAEPLGDNATGQALEGTGDTQPLEVPVVQADKNAAVVLAIQCARLIPAFHDHAPRVIVRREIAGPKKFEHGAGELPVGIAPDRPYLLRRLFPAEGHFEIGLRVSPAALVELVHQTAEQPGKTTKRAPRKQRNQTRKDPEAGELNTTTKAGPEPEVFPIWKFFSHGSGGRFRLESRKDRPGLAHRMPRRDHTPDGREISRAPELSQKFVGRLRDDRVD